MSDNKNTPSGLDSQTWNNMIQEVETVVENYYPQNKEPGTKEHATQVMEIIAMYMGGAIQQSIGSLNKEQFISLASDMYNHVGKYTKEEVVH